jgi:hypothetical protein
VTPLEPLFFGRDGFGKADYVYGTIYSELGMSIHYDEVQKRMFFGAPGTWNWTGTTVVYVNSKVINFLPFSNALFAIGLISTATTLF